MFKIIAQAVTWGLGGELFQDLGRKSEGDRRARKEPSLRGHESRVAGHKGSN